MAAKATDIRRVLADVEANARSLHDHSVVEAQLLAMASWAEAAAKARYVLNLYAATRSRRWLSAGASSEADVSAHALLRT
jgi:hypothetical protein